MPAPRRVHNLVGGEWKDGVTGKTFMSHNPADGEVVGHAPLSSPEDLDAAVEAARKAFEARDWDRNPVARARALYGVAQSIRRQADDLGKLLSRENGKLYRSSGMADTSLSEVERAADAFEYYAGLARNVYGRSTEAMPNGLSIITREPVGVVGIITPWNAPLVLLSRSLAPALAAGCTAVIKPASYVPASVAAFLEAFAGGLPPGVVNAVFGPGETIGKALASHGGVDMISFTGDTETGKEIMRLAAANMKRLSLELGGKSPNIIFEDAPMEAALRGALVGACLGSATQICFAGTRLLVHEGAHQRLVEEVKRVVPSMRLGGGLDQDADIGPVISEGQLKRVLGYVEEGRRHGQLLLGGKRATEGRLAKGYFMEPTVFDEVAPEARMAQEEIFGPVLSIIPFGDVEEAIRIANNTRYGLAAAIWTRDVSRALRVAREIRAGTVWVNTFGKLPPSVEMGGYKQSGQGRLYGLDGLRAFLEDKAIFIDYS